MTTMTTAVAPTTTLGEMVAENPARSRVLETFGLDYCCGGKATLEDACARKAIPVEAVLKALDDAVAGNGEGDGPMRGSLAELADYIERTHHDYLRAELPRLNGLLDKVVAAHGANSPYLHTLRDTYAPFRADLEHHMVKEERVLFPWIRRMEATGFDPAGAAASAGALSGPISVMEAEHEDAGRALEAFRALTDGYAPPPGACGTFRALLDGLATLERDMHRHVHLENSVLFPRAMAEAAAAAAAAARQGA